MNAKIYLKSQNNLKFNFCNRDLLGFRVALEHFDVFGKVTRFMNVIIVPSMAVFTNLQGHWSQNAIM